MLLQQSSVPVPVGTLSFFYPRWAPNFIRSRSRVSLFPMGDTRRGIHEKQQCQEQKRDKDMDSVTVVEKVERTVVTKPRPSVTRPAAMTRTLFTMKCQSDQQVYRPEPPPTCPTCSLSQPLQSSCDVRVGEPCRQQRKSTEVSRPALVVGTTGEEAYSGEDA